MSFATHLLRQNQMCMCLCAVCTATRFMCYKTHVNDRLTLCDWQF